MMLLFSNFEILVYCDGHFGDAVGSENVEDLWASGPGADFSYEHTPDAEGGVAKHGRGARDEGASPRGHGPGDAAGK